MQPKVSNTSKSVIRRMVVVLNQHYSRTPRFQPSQDQAMNRKKQNTLIKFQPKLPEIVIASSISCCLL